MGINDRVHELRKNVLALTLEEFGKRLGVQKSAISKIETGKVAVSDQMFKFICREFHISETWLRDGIGDPFEDRPNDDVIREFVDRSLAEQPPSVRRWVLSMLTEFSDGWWDEIEDVLKRIQNREIGPHADQMQDDALPAHLRPVAAHAKEGATVEELLEDAAMMAGSDDEEI